MEDLRQVENLQNIVYSLWIPDYKEVWIWKLSEIRTNYTLMLKYGFIAKIVRHQGNLTMMNKDITDPVGSSPQQLQLHHPVTAE
jgi:hypothetical protein